MAIGTPKDLSTELRKLLAYCEGPTPSRVMVASKLSHLANEIRTSSKPINRDHLLDYLVNSIEHNEHDPVAEMVKMFGCSKPFAKALVEGWYKNPTADLSRQQQKAEDLIDNLSEKFKQNVE